MESRKDISLIALLIIFNLIIVTLSGIILLKLSATKNNPTGRWYGWFMIAMTGAYGGSLIQLFYPSVPAPLLGLGSYLLESFGLRVAPYFYLLANLAYSPRFDKVKGQVIAWVAVLPLLALYIMDLFHPDEILASPRPGAPVPRGILGMAPLGYILLAYLLGLDSYRMETNGIHRRRRLYMAGVNLLLLPLALAAYGFLPLGAWTRIIWDQGFTVYVVLFMGFIARDKLFDYKVRVELSISLRSASSGVSLLNHAIKNELAKVHYYLQELAQKSSNPGEIQEEIQQIQTSTEHIMQMIARIQEKTQAVILKEQLASLNEIIHQAWSVWVLCWRKKRLWWRLPLMRRSA
ncbi:MAG TPA: hypothetical protein VHY08_17350 [Bacillota bacterium]|nr:hypothetical protein [Bacillota bacterium]